MSLKSVPLPALVHLISVSVLGLGAGHVATASSLRAAGRSTLLIDGIRPSASPLADDNQPDSQLSYEEVENLTAERLREAGVVSLAATEESIAN
ncbi:hypothetical protein C8Q72DRAFT_607375 [Fomitopsis betulina]|nr:hypothetical protein C8Q72DRAFT_607375 [Fomitopsis betulina]